MDNFMSEKYDVVYLKSIEKCLVCKSELSKNGTDEFLLNKNRKIRNKNIFTKIKKNVINIQEHV